MSANGSELFIVVSFSEKGDVFTVTDSEGTTILQRELSAIKDDVRGVLSTEDEIDDAEDGVQYAVPVDLAHEVFGWTL